MYSRYHTQESLTLIQKLRETLGGGDGTETKKPKNSQNVHQNPTKPKIRGNQNGGNDLPAFGTKNLNFEEENSPRGSVKEPEYKTTQVIDVTDDVAAKNLKNIPVERGDTKWQPHLFKTGKPVDTLEDLDILNPPAPPSMPMHAQHPPSMYQTLTGVPAGKPEAGYGEGLVRGAPVAAAAAVAMAYAANRRLQSPDMQPPLSPWDGFDKNLTNSPRSLKSQLSDADTRVLCEKNDETEKRASKKRLLHALTAFLVGAIIGILFTVLITILTRRQDCKTRANYTAAGTDQWLCNQTLTTKIISLESTLRGTTTEKVECEKRLAVCTATTTEGAVQPRENTQEDESGTMSSSTTPSSTPSTSSSIGPDEIDDEIGQSSFPDYGSVSHGSTKSSISPSTEGSQDGNPSSLSTLSSPSADEAAPASEDSNTEQESAATTFDVTVTDSASSTTGSSDMQSDVTTELADKTEMGSTTDAVDFTTEGHISAASESKANDFTTELDDHESSSTESGVEATTAHSTAETSSQENLVDVTESEVASDSPTTSNGPEDTTNGPEDTSNGPEASTEGNSSESDAEVVSTTGSYATSTEESLDPSEDTPSGASSTDLDSSSTSSTVSDDEADAESTTLQDNPEEVLVAPANMGRPTYPKPVTRSPLQTSGSSSISSPDLQGENQATEATQAEQLTTLKTRSFAGEKKDGSSHVSQNQIISKSATTRKPEDKKAKPISRLPTPAPPSRGGRSLTNSQGSKENAEQTSGVGREVMKRRKQKGWFQRFLEVVKDVVSSITPFKISSRDEDSLHISVD